MDYYVEDSEKVPKERTGTYALGMTIIFIVAIIGTACLPFII